MSRQSFSAWLKEQKARQDPIGDLARDAASDPAFPRSSQLAPLLAHLRARSAPADAITALEAAHAEFATAAANDQLAAGETEEAAESALIPIAEAARLTGATKKAIRSRVERGSLPAVLEDGVRKVSLADLARVGLLTEDGQPLEQPQRAHEEANGSMLVPLSDWQRLMEQVGNIFELSRELAETSARAAKAETQADFFRERLQEERERRQAFEEELAELRTTPAAAPATRRSLLGRLFGA